MRAYGISVGILAAILVFSLWNSSYMTASTVRWREQLQQADAQAQSEAWTEAVDTLAGSYDDWSESQTYLHIVARHDTVDDAEAMYRRALAFAATRELTDFRRSRTCGISSGSWRRRSGWISRTSSDGLHRLSARSLFSSVIKVSISLNWR